MKVPPFVVALLLAAVALAPGCGGETKAVRHAEPLPTPRAGLRYRIIGRADQRVPDAPVLAWPGTTISVVAEGTQLRARFREKKGPFGTSAYQVLVDGHEHGPPIALAEGESTRELATLGPGPHRVDLVKRTEAMSGTTTFLGFDGAALSSPPPARPRALEIVGDSNTTAYGVDGAGPRCRFSPDTQNFLHGYAWKVGLALNADVTAIAYSGKGIVQNYAREEKGTIGEIYPLTNPLDAESAAPPPAADAVVLFAGGNDYSYDDPKRRDPPDDRVFADAYAHLLQRIRAAHPRVPIVCVVTPAIADMDGDHARTSLESNIRAAILLSGDAATTFFLAPAQADATEQTGCDYHPNPGLHDRLAVTIAKMIEHAAYSTRHMP